MDPILTRWLDRQVADAMTLNESSDVVRVRPAPGPRPQLFDVAFDGPTVVSGRAGIETVRGFGVRIRFPDDYLISVPNVANVIALLAPRGIFHPNCKSPFICIGKLAPGTRLVEIVGQVWQILTYQRFTAREDDALDAEACAWARARVDNFPLTHASLRRGRTALVVDELTEDGP